MAQLKKISRQTDNRFLNIYEAEYYNEKTEKDFTYYIASRRDGGDLSATTGIHDRCDAVMAFCSFENGDIVLLRQFRPAVNTYLYESPAGLVDAEETPEEAIKREVYEETGLTVKEAKLFAPTSYNSAGMCDESLAVYLATVEGEISLEHKEENEDIEVIVLKADDIEQFMIEHGHETALKTNMMLMTISVVKDFMKGE